jgi:hypothetical protein
MTRKTDAVTNLRLQRRERTMVSFWRIVIIAQMGSFIRISAELVAAGDEIGEELRRWAWRPNMIVRTTSRGRFPPAAFLLRPSQQAESLDTARDTAVGGRERQRPCSNYQLNS